jgi:hypothetical protein
VHGSQVAQREVEDAALDRRPRQPAIAFCTLSIRLSSIALPPRLMGSPPSGWANSCASPAICEGRARAQYGDGR